MQKVITDQPRFNPTINIGNYFMNWMSSDPIRKTNKFKIIFSMKQSEIVKNSYEKIVINIKNSKFEKYKKNKNASSTLTSMSEITNKSYSIIKSLQMISTGGERSVTVNLASHLNNAAVNLLKNGYKPEDVPALYGPKRILVSEKKSNEDIASNQEHLYLSPHKISLLNFSLLQKKIHPYKVASEENFDTPEIKVLRNFYLNINDLENDQSKFYVKTQNELRDEIYLTAQIDIPEDFTICDIDFTLYKIGFSNFFYKKTKIFNFSSYLSHKKNIFNSPIINISGDYVSVRQTDEKSPKIEISKKSIFHDTSSTKYETRKISNIDHNKHETIKAQQKKSSLEIIKCSIPDSGKFSAVVNGNIETIDTTGLIVGSMIGDNAILIKLVNPPFDALEFKISKRSMRSNVHSTVMDISAFKSVYSQEVIDRNVKNYEIYEYFVTYKTKNGTIRMSTTSRIHEHVFSGFKGISTQIIPKSTSGDTIAFDIKTSIQKGMEDELLKQLKNQDLYDQYKDSLQSLLDEFSKLIFHKVDRINLSSGVRESFGITSNINFIDDDISRSKYGVSALDSSKNYLYEVYACLGHPKTLIKDSIVKEKKYIGNSIKEYYYNSHKWDHHRSSIYGTVYPLDISGKSFTPNQLEGQNIGLVAGFTANLGSLTKKEDKIYQFQINRISIDKINLQWKVSNFDLYDHFIIVKEVNQKREFLGAFDNFSVIDTIRAIDMGLIRYYIIPIMQNFSCGKIVISNSVTIDPEEFMAYNR
jgi:hypothetical protein